MARPFLLRALRQPQGGGPSLFARAVVVLILVGLLATMSPALVRAGAAVVHWLAATVF